MHQSVPFPFPGSAALYQGQVVRIHQHNHDKTALVFSTQTSLRAQLSDLSPLPECSPFERWCAERIVTTKGPAAQTPIRDAHNDHIAWLTANGIHESEWPSSEYRFRSWMIRAGYPITRKAIMREGEVRPYLRLIYTVSLAGVRQVAAA